MSNSCCCFIPTELSELPSICFPSLPSDDSCNSACCNSSSSDTDCDDYRYDSADDISIESSSTKQHSLPSKDITDRIVHLVEDYFSDYNLIQDEFLLKNIRRSKQGFVNLSLVASLRKIKAVTKFHAEPVKLIAYAIAVGSQKLELNACGTKIRRKIPLAPIDDCCRQERILIITGLSKEHANIDFLHQTFLKFGLIQSIRIFDCKSKEYSSLKKLCDKQPTLNFDSLQKQLVVTVEFNFKCDALKCYQMLNGMIDCEQDTVWKQVKLYLLMAK